MGLFNWILARGTKAIYVELPTPIVYALETVTYIQNQHRSEAEVEIKRDDVIALALSEYLQRNLWTTPPEDTVVHIPQKVANARPKQRVTRGS